MRHQESSSPSNSLNAPLGEPPRLPSVPPEVLTSAHHLTVATVPLKGGRVDLIVSAKGRALESVALTFENATRRQARSIKQILTAAPPDSRSTFDPVRSVSLMSSAIDFARFRQIGVTTPTGRLFHDELSEFFDREIAAYSTEQLKSIVRVEGLGGGIYHLSYPNPFMMSASFMRLQEHFESPKFRGKTFTTPEFKEWYSQSKEHGQFSYYSDWSGFNIPGDILRRFSEGAFDPLSPLELIIVDTFRDLKGPLYLIGTTQQDSISTLRHEIAHALYHTNPHYRTDVDQVLAPLNLTPIFRLLKALGYHRERWKDEAHAYLADPPAELESHGINPLMYEMAHHMLLKIFNHYSPVRTSSPKAA